MEDIQDVAPAWKPPAKPPLEPELDRVAAAEGVKEEVGEAFDNDMALTTLFSFLAFSGGRRRRRRPRSASDRDDGPKGWSRVSDVPMW